MHCASNEHSTWSITLLSVSFFPAGTGPFASREIKELNFTQWEKKVSSYLKRPNITMFRLNSRGVQGLQCLQHGPFSPCCCNDVCLRYRQGSNELRSTSMWSTIWSQIRMNLDLSFQIFHKCGLLLTLHSCKSQNESSGKIYRASTADGGQGTWWLQSESAAASCLLRHLKEFTVLASDNLACKLANHESSFLDSNVPAESRHVGNPEA